MRLYASQPMGVLPYFPIGLEAHCAMVVVKADDEVLKKRHPANHIKMHVKLCRETYWPSKAILSELESHRVQIDGHEAPITDLDIDAISTLPIQAKYLGQCWLEYAIERA